MDLCSMHVILPCLHPPASAAAVQCCLCCKAHFVPLPPLLTHHAGLAGCNISTAAPGQRNITFSVTDSLGRRAVANRTLVVQQQCTAGERRCSDQVGGECLRQRVVTPAGVKHPPRAFQQLG